MYKVFINDKPIIIGDYNDINENYPVLVFEEIDIFELIEESLKNNDFNGVNLITKDLQNAWEEISKKIPVVSASGGLVINKENKILFIYRFDKWDLPKGKIEKGESKEEGAIREVEEECGINNLKIDDFLLTTYHFYWYDSKIKIKETFWYLMNTNFKEELIPQLEEGITKVEFKEKNEVSKILDNSYANIKLVYESYQKK